MDNATVAGWKLFSTRGSTRDKQLQDRPNYWVYDPQALNTSARVKFVSVGSGHEVYGALLPQLEHAETEILLVTCFWARSATLDALNQSLKNLSSKAERKGRKIRVRLCFSSLSLTQKLFHTRSLQGQVYPSSCWVRKFGLPAPEQLRGLDLQIKSIFVLPFSVMHPKFIIVDRRTVFLPSCNISWENWFEACIELTGDIVDQFTLFYKMFWASDDEVATTASGDTQRPETELSTVQTIFLPSPHHAISVIDWPGSATSPPTPLNIFTLEAISKAQKTVYIQTPNLTARPVLDAILAALARGVGVSIVTSEKLMVMEQLVTARTTTARCISWLTRQHASSVNSLSKDVAADGEEGRKDVGTLTVHFYTPRPDLNPDDPVQTHLKFMLVDSEIVLLGSGNMDRASWVTSQELGVAIIDKTVAALIKQRVSTALEGRLTRVYN